MRNTIHTCAVVAAILLATSNFLIAQEKDKKSVTKSYTLEEIVVSATRTETRYKEIASSITVITAEEIANSQQTLLLDLLRSLPSIDVVRTGGHGGQTSVFIRGANSNHTLVLIDGVEANDPVSPGRAFDFASLTTDNIERIEILRGPQSTLYGSDAMAGVINITTKKGAGRPRLTFTSNAGSFNTFKNNLNIAGGNSKLDYSLAFSLFETDGISAANGSPGNIEKDGYTSSTLSGRVGIKTGENSGISIVTRYIDSKADIDNGGGRFGDDPNNTLDTEQIYIRGEAHFISLNSLWKQKFGVSYTGFDRININKVDAEHPQSSYRSSAKGSIVKFDWQSTLYLNDRNTLIFGIETEEETGSSERTGDFPSVFAEKNARSNGFYAQDQINVQDMFFVTAGIRVDDHDKFGTHATYRLTSAYFVEQTETKFKATYGTGFRAPSLYQLYSIYGNTHLKPDESEGWDIGLEQYFNDSRVAFGFTFFQNDFKNLIDFDLGTFTYNNIGAAKTRGIEIYFNVLNMGGFDLRTNYTYTDTEDESTGENFIRRAKHKIGMGIHYEFSEKATATLNLTGSGDRNDLDFSTFPANRVVLSRYLLVDLAARYNLTDRIHLIGSIDNLFDTSYETVLGFGTYGISFNGGLGLRF